jgi:hypothetical protein
MPDNPGASENIVLMVLARIHMELRHTRPEISPFSAQAEVRKDSHIKPESGLQDSRGGPRRACVWASEKQGRACCEMAEPAA